MTSLLPVTLKGVTVRRGGRTILGPVDATLSGQGITMLLGANGAGKTTLLRAMHGLERLSDGTVSWAAPDDTVKLRQAFVFQTPILLRRPVVDNIAYPLFLRGTPRQAARDEAARVATDVGLERMLNQSAMVLSGGEKQKLAIARALIVKPLVLFLDEPCANLDSRATRDIEALLSGIREAGTRIVMSTHNLGQARRLADDIWFLHDGRLVESSSADTFLSQPASPEAAAFLRGDLLP